MSELVLVVDDFAETRACYAELFRIAGFRVEVASDGDEALRIVERCAPALVVTDLNMPVTDGVTLAGRLRHGAANEPIAIIAVTAFPLRAIVCRAREAGCDAILSKPCPADTLIGTAKQLLSRGGTKEGRRRHA